MVCFVPPLFCRCGGRVFGCLECLMTWCRCLHHRGAKKHGNGEQTASLCLYCNMWQCAVCVCSCKYGVVKTRMRFVYMWVKLIWTAYEGRKCVGVLSHVYTVTQRAVFLTKIQCPLCNFALTQALVGSNVHYRMGACCISPVTTTNKPPWVICNNQCLQLTLMTCALFA